VLRRDLLDPGRCCTGIHSLRLESLEAEHDRTRCAVPYARRAKRTEELDPQPRYVVEQSVGSQPGDETSGSAHGTDGV
jgi:hypothetical protein